MEEVEHNKRRRMKWKRQQQKKVEMEEDLGNQTS